MGLKLEDVAWDPKHAGRMAVVGSGSHNVVVVDIGQVRPGNCLCFGALLMLLSAATTAGCTSAS